MEEIKCVGCDRTAKECGYNERDSVKDDGTYYNGAFVCDRCYSKLIDKGLDVGPAIELQQYMKAIREDEEMGLYK